MIFFKDMLYPEIIKPKRFLSLMTPMGINGYLLQNKKYVIKVAIRNGNLKDIFISTKGFTGRYVQYSFNKQKKVSVKSLMYNINIYNIGSPHAFSNNSIFNTMGIDTYHDLVHTGEDIINFNLTLRKIPTIKIYPTIEDFIKESKLF